MWQYRIVKILKIIGSHLLSRFAITIVFDTDHCFHSKSISLPEDWLPPWVNFTNLFGPKRKCASSHSSALFCFTNKICKMLLVCKAKYTLKFYTVRPMACASKIGINLLAQKLHIKCWWNWPLFFSFFVSPVQNPPKITSKHNSFIIFCRNLHWKLWRVIITILNYQMLRKKSNPKDLCNKCNQISHDIGWRLPKKSCTFFEWPPYMDKKNIIHFYV